MNKHRKAAELSFILGFCDSAKGLMLGRLESLRHSLSKAAERQVRVLGNLSDADVNITSALITQFYNETGWSHKKHALSRLSFFLGYADKWPAIMEALTKFQEHFDRAKRNITLCELSGERALGIWEAICRTE